MIVKTIKYTSLLLLFVFANCTTNSKEDTTYFGGRIINPKSDHVILYSLDKAIDTFLLDKKNNFIGEIKNAKEGLYYFAHGTENQFIYLEPKDSLMLRLNTWDFDESLVFAGKGAERNNILIDCFLQDEKDNRTFYELNRLNPALFEKKIDSLLNLKLKTYNNYVQNHINETNGFNSILNVALTYPLYARKERYPERYAYYKGVNKFPELSSNFYKHREKINTSRDSLMYYYPYSNYIRNYLYNLTYSLGHPPMTKEYSSKFTIDLLNTIDKKIESEESKNAFLKQTVIEHFYRKSSCNVNEEPFNKFFELSSNKEDKIRLNNLLNDNKAIHKGKPIKEFEIKNLSNGEHSIKDVLKDKPTFLFFWNPKFVSKGYVSSRIKYLSNKYSNIQFLLIKIDGDNTDRINNLDIKTQYFIDKNSKANSFLTSKMPRVILINKDGIVENGYASISSKKIYSQLDNLNKK